MLMIGWALPRHHELYRPVRVAYAAVIGDPKPGRPHLPDALVDTRRMLYHPLTPDFQALLLACRGSEFAGEECGSPEASVEPPVVPCALRHDVHTKIITNRWTVHGDQRINKYWLMRMLRQILQCKELIIERNCSLSLPGQRCRSYSKKKLYCDERHIGVAFLIVVWMGQGDSSLQPTYVGTNILPG